MWLVLRYLQGTQPCGDLAGDVLLTGRGPRAQRLLEQAGSTKVMLIGERIRHLREERGLSRADIEQATGLLRSYVCRVELGQSIPSLEALERFAAALEVPLYWLFYAEEPDDNATGP